MNECQNTELQIINFYALINAAIRTQMLLLPVATLRVLLFEHPGSYGSYPSPTIQAKPGDAFLIFASAESSEAEPNERARPAKGFVMREFLQSKNERMPKHRAANNQFLYPN